MNSLFLCLGVKLGELSIYETESSFQVRCEPDIFGQLTAMGSKNPLKIIRANRKAGFAVLAVAIALGVVAWRIFWYEPSYDGTRLSAWLPEFQNGKVERRLRAAEAVRHMGRAAVPYLVRHLQRPSPTQQSREWQWRLRFADWLAAHTPLKISTPQSPSYRLQALAALDALGADGQEALPVLEKLIEEHPEEPALVFAVARLGVAGVPLLKKSLTNSAPHDSETLRLAARVGLIMVDSKSYVLHPELAPDPASGEYLARCGWFSYAMAQTGVADYREQRPGLVSSNDFQPLPASVFPRSPVFDVPFAK